MLMLAHRVSLTTLLTVLIAFGESYLLCMLSEEDLSTVTSVIDDKYTQYPPCYVSAMWHRVTCPLYRKECKHVFRQIKTNNFNSISLSRPLV